MAFKNSIDFLNHVGGEIEWWGGGKEKGVPVDWKSVAVLNHRPGRTSSYRPCRTDLGSEGPRCCLVESSTRPGPERPWFWLRTAGLV